MNRVAGAVRYEIKTSPEMSDEDRFGVCRLFGEVFGRSFGADLFERKYDRTFLGKSFHALMVVDSQVVGAYSAIPVRYRFFGAEKLFAIAVDLMLHSRFRGNLRHLRTLSELLFAKLAAEEVAFVFGCARDEMLLVHEHAAKWRPVGAVRYYVAPIAPLNLPGLATLARWLADFGAVLQSTLSAISPRPPTERCGEPGIEKVNDEPFRNHRYGVFPLDYKVLVTPDGGHAVYVAGPYWPIPGISPRIRLGFLLDVWPLTRCVFDHAVDAIRRSEKTIDFLIYLGHLQFCPHRMLRIPTALERQPWHLAGRILRPDLVDERIYDIGNWRINLSDGDLV